VIAIGFGIAWAGYAAFMWGYCLVRDYDVTPLQLLKTTWPGAGKSGATGHPGTKTGTTQAPGTTTAAGRG